MFRIVGGHQVAGLLPAEQQDRDAPGGADLLRLSSLRTGGVLIMLPGSWNAGGRLVLSLYFQQVLRDSPLMTGLAIAPQGVVGFAAGVAGARLAGRLGLRRLPVLTNAAAAFGFLLLTRLPAIAPTAGHSRRTAGVSGDRAAMLAGARLARLIALAQHRPGHARAGQADRAGTVPSGTCPGCPLRTVRKNNVG